MSLSPERSPAVHEQAENWEQFNKRLEVFSDTDRKDIQFAYQLAKAAHRGQMRIGHDRYFEHLRSATLILLDECGIQDPPIIKATLLHDSMEDTSIFGNPVKMPYSTWVSEAHERLALNFGSETADMVVTLTKPQIDNEVFHTKAETKAFYYEQISHANSKTLLIKMADRLHNLRTQYDTTLEQQIKKVKETNEIYLPIFRNVQRDYPEEEEYLVTQIEEEVAKVEKNILVLQQQILS